jgi:small GTP-binding protein
MQGLLQAHAHLNQLLEDTSIPAAVRAELSAEFEELQELSERIRREEIHIAAFGRVGVGKSSLLNALLGKQVFATSPLHGETKTGQQSAWTRGDEQREGQVVLIDTPGIDELGGEDREALAHRIARRSDIVMMVCEGDLVDKELQALRDLAGHKRAVILVLNKSDHYTGRELDLIIERLTERTADVMNPAHIVAVSADPRSAASTGSGPDIARLQALLWNILERQGKSLAALNASLFASELDQKVATQIVQARQTVANRIVRNYCISKGLLVAVNPVPVADLLAAAGSDVAMVIHLGEVYGFRLNRRESAKLLLTISTQLAALMGAYWGTNLISSLLKTASAGLSTTLTAAAQGALAWYATLVTGRMAQTWFARGKSWGGQGPRETAHAILASLDRDDVLTQARDELAAKLQIRNPG